MWHGAAPSMGKTDSRGLMSTVGAWRQLLFVPHWGAEFSPPWRKRGSMRAGKGEISTVGISQRFPLTGSGERGDGANLRRLESKAYGF